MDKVNNITGLYYIDGKLGVKVDDDSNIIFMDEHTIRSMYPNIVYIDNIVYIADENIKNKLKIDIDSDLGKHILSDIDIARIKSTCFYKNIPENLKDKYCIIYGTNIIASFDTEDGARTSQKNEYKYLATTLYIPENKIKKVENVFN